MKIYWKNFPNGNKEQTGEEVELIYQVFDMPEVMYTKISLGREDFDLACPTQYIFERMLHNDLLLPIDTNFGRNGKLFEKFSSFFNKSY
jgi:spermidine/putrescine transport system substrate-binding protein